jgi:transcriptional regulator with XRE-family HTH domain
MTVQREIPILSAMPAPAEVERHLVESCRDELMALNRCIDLSGMADSTLADALGIDPAHWSRIRKGRAHFPARKRLALMSLAGNILPLQYEAWRLGRKLEPLSDHEKQIRELEAKLEELRRVA